MAAPTVTVERITPSQAKKMLEGNTNNRKPKFVRIKRYAADMAAGRWQVTGESIKLNGSQLLDGQNRLLACIEADTPFTTLVVRGLDGDVMDVIDSGAARSVGDSLSLRGYSNSHQMAATAKLVLQWRSGHINDNAWAAANITPAQVTEFADQHGELMVHVVNIGWTARRGLNLVNTATSTFTFEAHQQGFGEKADEFVATMVEGANLPKGDPRLAMRNWAANIGASRRLAVHHLHAYVTAWNAAATGGQLQIIRPWFKTSAFPTLKAPTR